MLKGSGEQINRSPSRQVTILSNLVTIETGSGDIMAFVCQVIKRSCDFIEEIIIKSSSCQVWFQRTLL